MIILLLPLVPFLLLLAAAAARCMLVDLWREGAIQAFLLLVALPMVVWIACLALRDWRAARRKREEERLKPDDRTTDKES